MAYFNAKTKQNKNKAKKKRKGKEIAVIIGLVLWVIFTEILLKECVGKETPY